jgi:hypothetical protein
MLGAVDRCPQHENNQTGKELIGTAPGPAKLAGCPPEHHHHGDGYGEDRKVAD